MVFIKHLCLFHRSFTVDDIIICFPLRNVQEDVRYKAGLVSALIDALALSGKCTSGPNKSMIIKVYILVSHAVL